MADKTVYVHPVGDDTGDHYHTLADAIAGELIDNADLTAMAGILHIIIDGTWSSADTAAVVVNGFTTSAAYYPHIYATGEARHHGIPSASHYEVYNSGGTAIYIDDNYVRVDGLQARSAGTGSMAGILTADHAIGVRVSNCLGKAETTTAGYGAFANAGEYSSINYWNCIAYDSGGAGFAGAGTMVAENCDAMHCNWGFCTIYANATTWTNCLAHGSVVADFINPDGADPVVTYCASGDATADDWGGAGNHVSHTFTFVDHDGNDFHLASGDVGAIGLGTATPGSGYFSDDVDGKARGATWDIGFDQHAAGGDPLSLGAHASPTVKMNW